MSKSPALKYSLFWSGKIILFRLLQSEVMDVPEPWRNASTDAGGGSGIFDRGLSSGLYVVHVFTAPCETR